MRGNANGRPPLLPGAAAGRVTRAVEIPVLGIVTRFISNSEHVLRVVDDAFGMWRSLDDSLIEDARPQTVRVNVQTGPGSSEEAPDDITHFLPGEGRLLIHGRRAAGISDPHRNEAVAWVWQETLHERERFRYDVLEALTWALLTRCDRQPLHAAALVKDGAGLLLCGPSGSGKSTLAYAAARSGMHVLSEDIVFVQRQPHLHVWGSHGPFRLLPSAATRFAELASVAPTRLHNGKEKVIVAAHANAAPGRARVVRDCGVCVLGERRAEAQCRPLSCTEAMSLIDLAGDPGFDAFADSIAPAVERLAHNGAWLLHPSRSPDDSIPLLACMLGAVGARRENTVAGA